MSDDDYDDVCDMQENVSVFKRTSKRWAGRDHREV